MSRAFLPFKLFPSHAARDALGRELETAAVLALRAILKANRSLEIAHQQISFRRHCLAFSSRITEAGDLVLDLDLGDPRLANRLILEEDLKAAHGRLRGQRPPTRGLSR